jgi:mono/diheme cytochrome c family protein
MTTNAGKSTAAEPRLTGLVAEFETPDAVIHAAEKVRDAGFTKWDVHTPFPVHGIDEAMGIRPTILPWIVAAMACTGFTGALALQYLANAVFYPFIISGKPTFAIEPCLPVCFEVAVLLSAFGAFFGMLGLNGLPKPSNDLLRATGFLRATNDRFFIAIDAIDRKFNQTEVTALLERIGGKGVTGVYTDPNGDNFPKILHTIALTTACLALTPPVLIAARRVTDQPMPRLHLIPDMDFQVKKKTQKTTTLFADGRIMRPAIAGTVPRGMLMTDSKKFAGLESAAGLMMVADVPAEPAKAAAAPVDPAAAAAERDKKPWVKTVPIPVTPALMARGQERYRVYCSVCHGLTGDGGGLVSLRAAELEQPTWTRPVSLTSDTILKQPVGQIFDTISHGVRRMQGYGDQISVEDRWAIAAYVKALQRSRAAQPGDLPDEELEKLKAAAPPAVAAPASTPPVAAPAKAAPAAEPAKDAPAADEKK